MERNLLAVIDHLLHLISPDMEVIVASALVRVVRAVALRLTIKGLRLSRGAFAVSLGSLLERRLN